MYYIYWIKRKCYTDPENEGYIGFSNDPNRRFQDHLRTKNSRLSNSIKKYSDDIEMIILEQFESKEEALEREKKLRPKKYIGWNVAPGGQVPPEIKLSDDYDKIKKKISETLKSKGACPYSEKTHSPEAIAKRKRISKEQEKKWAHDPITGERKIIKTGYGETLPNGWEWGKVKKKPIVEKKENSHMRNVLRWEVTSPEGETFIVISLKTWCRDNNIKYYDVYTGTNGWKSKKLGKIDKSNIKE